MVEWRCCRRKRLKLKLFTHALALGLYLWVPTEGSCKRLFFVLSTRNRLAVGDPYGRARGHALLWVRSERAQQVAKPEPVTERLAGMCGSVRH